MSDTRTERRRTNGSRLEGRALAMQVAKEANGKVLAQAYIMAKSAGFRLYINKCDGVPKQGQLFDDGHKVMVDIVGGIVQKAWAAP